MESTELWGREQTRRMRLQKEKIRWQDQVSLQKDKDLLLTSIGRKMPLQVWLMLKASAWNVDWLLACSHYILKYSHFYLIPHRYADTFRAYEYKDKCLFLHFTLNNTNSYNALIIQVYKLVKVLWSGCCKDFFSLIVFDSHLNMQAKTGFFKEQSGWDKACVLSST